MCGAFHQVTLLQKLMLLPKIIAIKNRTINKIRTQQTEINPQIKTAPPIKPLLESQTNLQIQSTSKKSIKISQTFTTSRVTAQKNM